MSRIFSSLRHRLTYANVVATLALFIALGGSAYAVATITGSDVKDGSLTGRDIKHNTLDLAHLRGHDHAVAPHKAKALVGKASVVGNGSAHSTQAETGLQLIRRYGPAPMGRGRLESRVACRSGEVVGDGEANYRDLLQPPYVDLFHDTNEVRAVGYGRDHGRGYVQAIADCLAVR